MYRSTWCITWGLQIKLTSLVFNCMFSVCYLHNVFTRVVYRLCTGCVPVVYRLCTGWVLGLCTGCVLGLCTGCVLGLCTGMEKPKEPVFRFGLRTVFSAFEKPVFASYRIIF